MITKAVQTKKLVGYDYKQSAECLHPVGFSTDVCSDGHVSTRFFRCNQCDGCEVWRIRTIRAQVFNRIKSNNLIEQEGLLWTFGTNLKYNSDNYNKLRKYWKKFVDWIRHTYNFIYYFRVFEAGSKGGRLHIHVVTNIWSKREDFVRIRAKWSEITAIKNPNVNFRRVKRCSKCKKLVDYYQVKTHCGGNRKFEKVGIKTAILYLTKYLTKEQKEKVGMRHNYYWGKPLFYKWKTTKEEYSGWNYDADEPMKYVKLQTNGNGHFRELGYIYGRSYRLKAGKYVVDGLHKMPIKRYWRDVDITCPVEECENIVIKGINLMQYDKAYQLMRGRGIPKVRIKEILSSVVMQSFSDYT